ncbi:MAG: DNA polymerase Y family protein [Burkholderiales bacterium]|nr:DNA polymerase Y family protein [Burkholderiales bacterium]
MEVQSSLKLFKGEAAVKARIGDEAPDLGVIGIGWAPNAMAALLLARCGVLDLGDHGLQAVLDPLPLIELTAAAQHAEVLARMGVNTLGQLRRLPRDGVSRRWGDAILTALDQAYGRLPQAHKWEVIPETFSIRYELPAREDNAPALLAYARPMLMQMCGWLSARHAGAEGYTLRWAHDSMRAKEAGDGGEVIIRSAEPMRDLEHFTRLLAEHLAKLELLAPVGELRLEAVGVERVTEQSMSLLPQSLGDGESLFLLAERLAARFGPECVVKPYLGDDHRTQYAVHWSPAAKRKPRKPEPVPELNAPTILQDEPIRLAVREGCPHYQGPLTLLTGPELVECGWWDRVPGTSITRSQQRDYWVAVSETAGTLSIFCTQMDDGELAWFLDGAYA